MTKLKKLIIAFGILVAVIGVAGFFIVPAVVKPLLIQKIAEATHRPVSVEEIKFNPFAFSAKIRGFKIGDPDRTSSFVMLEELYVNVDATMSILRRALILEVVQLKNPYVVITRKPDGTYNFSDLLPKEEAKKETIPSKPFYFSINNILIAGGKIDYHDQPNKTDHTVRDMQLSIPFISNVEYDVKKYVEPKFSASVNGNPIQVTGKTMPFESSHATVFDLVLSDINLPYYLQYVPVRMNFKLTSAVLDTRLRVTFMTYPDKTPDLSFTGQAALKKVSLVDLQGNNILRLPSLKVDIASVEPFTAKVHLANIAIDAPELVLKRDKKGVINFATLVDAPKSADQKTKLETKSDKSPQETSKKALSLFIDNLLIDKADITYLDAQPAQPVKIRVAPLRLQASKLTLNKDEKAQLDLALVLDKKSDITVKGSLGLNPLAADLALDVKNIAIGPFQAYLPESVQMDITSGAIATDGKLVLKMDKNEKPSIAYAGKLAILRFATIDRAHSNDFLKFKRLSLDALSVGYNPFFVNIREVSFTDFFARIAINEGGSTNIQDIFGVSKKKEQNTQATAEAPAPKAEKGIQTTEPPPDVKIGKVSFSGGTVDFSDHNIKPNYRAKILNLQGSITGLSSQEFTRAGVALKGNLGYGSPVEIGGTINPLIKDAFADLKISFKDIDMSPVSPYTIRFLGYPIVKGKLNFDVSYLIDQRKLTAQNKVLFDQLTFGERVESPSAIKAPVTLAVSLLTDRNGQINLDIPVSGSLDDPKFKVWPVIWQILVNLITKAVTSPFALVSSLTGGGEEMSYTEFDYGSSQLSETELKKITGLTKVLFDRPNLKIDIEGHVDAQQDKEALKKRRFTRLLKTQKFKEMMSKGQSDASIETIVISPSEYEKYLTLAYKASDFPRPQTTLGFLKELPASDMEKLMLDNIAVTEQDLEQLAARRAQKVRDEILQTGKIEPSRIYLTKSAALTPEKKDKVKDSRVNFKLK